MKDAPRTSPEFIEWLVGRHADLAPILDEHLADNGELLPHVFFGDVTRHASAMARAGTNTDAVDGLLGDLDDSLSLAKDDDQVDNLIGVSFVENAQGIPGDAEEELRRRLRMYPNLARALSRYER